MRLKWNATEYTGRLVSVDSYMNIQLSGAQEWMGGKSEGVLGQVLIRYVTLVSVGGREGVEGRGALADWGCRCNNVLWISGRKRGENGDAEMEG